jgi:hypothetical protein
MTMAIDRNPEHQARFDIDNFTSIAESHNQRWSRICS